MNFAERMGLVPPKLVQFNEMDEKLRNTLWNVFYFNFFENESNFDHRAILLYETYYNEVYRLIWLEYFVYKINNLPETFNGFRYYVEEYFFSCDWKEVYTFIEFIVQNIGQNESTILQRQFNHSLANQASGYRFLNKYLAPIIDNVELKEINNALDNSEKHKYEGVKEHISQSIALLSIKDNPDYRNSIKESISAVESLCKILTNDDKATLGQALSILKNREDLELHEALLVGFKNLFGYTSDEKGIRHSLLDKSTIELEDAVFMLVSCSAFVNYLIVKNEKGV